VTPVPVTVLLGSPPALLPGSASPALLARLAASGIAPERLAPQGMVPVTLLIRDPEGLSLNLGALLAFQEAEPGHSAELLWAGPNGPEPTGIRAVPAAPASQRVRHLLQPADRVEAVLLDRDGTLIVDRRYLGDPSGVELIPMVEIGLSLLQRLGIARVVVTNQSGVARGLIRPEQVEAVHDRLRSLLGTPGLTLDGIYWCPHAESDGCECRKPRAGMARAAAAALGFDLARAVVIGDTEVDVGLARTLGVPAFLVLTGRGKETLAEGTTRPDFLVSGLDALAVLLTHPAGAGRPLPAQASHGVSALRPQVPGDQ
jgi:D-glycero-D-manno-heptose 1,7-bisphosphate phosphatase